MREHIEGLKGVKVIADDISELQQQRRRRQPGRQKAIGLLRKTETFQVSRFFVHFFTVLARLRRENA